MKQESNAEISREKSIKDKIYNEFLKERDKWYQYFYALSPNHLADLQILKVRQNVKITTLEGDVIKLLKNRAYCVEKILNLDIVTKVIMEIKDASDNFYEDSIFGDQLNATTDNSNITLSREQDKLAQDIQKQRFPTNQANSTEKIQFRLSTLNLTEWQLNFWAERNISSEYQRQNKEALALAETILKQKADEKKKAFSKPIDQLLDNYERSLISEEVEGLALNTFGEFATIENDEEKALRKKPLEDFSSDQLLRFQFVKLKRTYLIKKRDCEFKIQQPCKLSIIEVDSNKFKAINFIIYNENKELHERLANQKDGDEYADISHYYGKHYVNPNDAQFQKTETALYFKTKIFQSTAPKKFITTEKEYENAKKGKAYIWKRQFNTKLHSFIKKIVDSYEKDGKDIFDDFEAIKRFIKNNINKRCVIKRKKALLPQNLAIPSAIGYEHAFTPYPEIIVNPNGKAYLRILSNESIVKLKAKEEIVTISSLKFDNNILGRNYTLLNAIYTLLKETPLTQTESNIVFYEQDLAKLIGKDVVGDRKGILISELKQFDDLVGIFDDGSFYKLLGINSFDKTTGKTEAYIGYFRILERILQSPKPFNKSKKILAPNHTHLIHANIITKIKSHIAVEVINFITIKIQQAGGKIPKGKQRKEISLKPNTVVEAIPQLNETLISARQTKTPAQSQNDVLKRTFISAYAGLEKHTDLFNYYNDFQIPSKIPTVTTIEVPLTFSHKGINNSYKLPPKK